MAKLQMVAEVDAPPKSVWEILADSAYLPKLYPNVIMVEAEQPGATRVGSKFRIFGKAGRRRVEVFAEIADLEAERRFVAKNRAGGLFKSFESVVQLAPKGKGTQVSITFEYELSTRYVGKLFNLLLLERLVADNVRAYAKNLKDFSELLPLTE